MLGLGALHAQAVALVGRALLFSLQVVQQALHLDAGRADVLTRPGDDLLGQSQPRGDGQRVAAPGEADAEAIGRRERPHVELDRGVDDAGPVVGEDFQLGVVRRRHRVDLARQQIDEDGARKRGALARIGARA